MATLAESGFPNLANWSKRHNPDGSIADIVDIVSKKMPLLDDIPWQEGNSPTGHRITQALALPSATWRKLNSGVAATKTDVEQFDEQCGMLEDESKVDIALAALNGDAVAWRASEDKLKKEALGQQLCTSVFYESASSNPERIHGLAPRYGATSGLTSSSYVLKPGTNSGVNCRSVWLITWDLRKIYGIFPKGSMAGLQVTDRGEQRVLDASSNAFYAYCTQFSWKCGIAVEDYRYAVRLQWDPDDATFDQNERGLYMGMMNQLTQIYERLPSTRFYMDRTSYLLLNQQLAANDANYLTHVDKGGDMVPTFLGVPIRVSDSLVAETAIS